MIYCKNINIITYRHVKAKRKKFFNNNIYMLTNMYYSQMSILNKIFKLGTAKREINTLYLDKRNLIVNLGNKKSFV